MLTSYLIPHRYRSLGWVLLIPALAAGVFYLATGFTLDFLDVRVFSLFDAKFTFFNEGDPHSVCTKVVKNNITDELIAIVLMAGLVLVAFSQEVQEDELIMKIRLDALLWAAYVNIILFLFATVLLYEIAYLHFMIINMFLLPILFIGRFRYKMWKLKREEL